MGGHEARKVRFIRAFERLSGRARARLVIENDDRVFALKHVLEIAERTGLRVVWDVLHHHCDDPDGLSDREALRLALATWPVEQTPKTHYSSPRTSIEQRVAKRGRSPVLPPLRAHADIVDPVPRPNTAQIGHRLSRIAQQSRALSADARERAFLEAVAEGGELPLRPAIQDLERYAPAWVPLVPPDPARRAGVFDALGERYVFTARVVPELRQALGVEEPAVEDAYSRLYGRPLVTAFARELPRGERLAGGGRGLAPARQPAGRLAGVRVDADGVRQPQRRAAGSADRRVD